MFVLKMASYEVAPLILIGIAIIAFIIYIIYVANEKRKKRQEERQEEERVAAENLAKALAEQQKRRTVATFAEKYKCNPMTEKLAQKAAEYFIKKIKGLDRDKRKTSVTFTEEGIGVELRYAKPNISILSYSGEYFFEREELINFTRENLRAIDSVEELKGFVDAIATRAEEIFRNTYYRDESGTAYTLTSKRIDTENASYEGSRGYMIQFCYSARNGFYEAPKEW